jgi:hypothetical protein
MQDDLKQWSGLRRPDGLKPLLWRTEIYVLYSDQLLRPRAGFRPVALEVDDDEARFQVFTTVSFVASVSADDPNTGYYDREDGAIYGMDRIERSVHGNVEVTITGQLTNFADKPDDAVVTCDGIYNESGRDNVIVLHLDDEDER